MSALPAAFADLEPFAPRWLAPGIAARAALRDRADPAEARAFHAALAPRLGAILDHLDARPLAALPPEDAALMELALAFAHVALALEIQGDAEPFHAGQRAAMAIVHAPAEPWRP